MKKTLITAAAVAMSASVAGIAYAASPGTAPASDDRYVVVPAVITDDPAGDRGRGRDPHEEPPGDRGRGRDAAQDDVPPTTIPTVEHPAGDDRGMDDPGMDDRGMDD